MLNLKIKLSISPAAFTFPHMRADVWQKQIIKYIQCLGRYQTLFNGLQRAPVHTVIAADAMQGQVQGLKEGRRGTMLQQVVHGGNALRYDSM